jgi:hypothetical protein
MRLFVNMVKVSDNKLNRRLAFRIYDQVNLFYHKIDHNQAAESRLDFGNIIDNSSSMSQITENLPDSQSQENDTLNVNISSSGMAFTCKDKLQTGDYLMVRILILSSMTLIMTCCKVVYCKPSNPYEKNQFPYLIGAHFVKMTAEDSALLNGYVNRRKKQHFLVNGLMAILAMGLLAMPEEIFSLFLELCDALLDHINSALEYLSYGFEYLVNYFFHTNPHDTEIVAFYLQSAFELAGLYVLLRIIVSFFVRLSQSLRAFLSRKKASFFYYWGEQTLLYKIGSIGLVTIVITCYGLFGI